MKKNIIAAGLLALALCACKHDGFTIEGTIRGVEAKTVWIEEIAPEETMFIDSVKTDADGHFKFHYNPPYQSLFNLHLTDNNFIVLLPSNGETIDLDIQVADRMLSYDVSGSPGSHLLWLLEQQTNQGTLTIYQLIDSTRHYDDLLAGGYINQAEYDRRKAGCDSVYLATLDDQRQYVCHFIEENSGSLASLIALYKTFNSRPLIDPRDTANLRYYNLVLEGLEERLPQNPHTVYFRSTTEHLRAAHKPQTASNPLPVQN